jgi:hypothetical protein
VYDRLGDRRSGQAIAKIVPRKPLRRSHRAGRACFPLFPPLKKERPRPRRGARQARRPALGAGDRQDRPKDAAVRAVVGAWGPAAVSKPFAELAERVVALFARGIGAHREETCANCSRPRMLRSARSPSRRPDERHPAGSAGCAGRHQISIAETSPRARADGIRRAYGTRQARRPDRHPDRRPAPCRAGLPTTTRENPVKLPFFALSQHNQHYRSHESRLKTD